MYALFVAMGWRFSAPAASSSTIPLSLLLSSVSLSFFHFFGIPKLYAGVYYILGAIAVADVVAYFLFLLP